MFATLNRPEAPPDRSAPTAAPTEQKPVAVMNAQTEPLPDNLPATATGERIYTIGDIHGRFDLLQELLEQISRYDTTLKKAKSTSLVILGDMIDRGPDSARTLDYLYHLARRRKVTVLLGNHEDVLLRAIGGETGVMSAWMRFGGRETLQSYGVTPPEKDEGHLNAARQLAEAIPPHILAWLRSLPVSARSGDYFFCHAGIKPGLAPNRQQREDLLWIRREFLESNRDYGVVVVHGHSIAPDVEVRHNRIGIDTGAYRTGNLTALYLEGTECGVLSTGETARPSAAPEEAWAAPSPAQPETARPETAGTETVAAEAAPTAKS